MNMPFSGIYHFEPPALFFSHFCEKSELCDCIFHIVIIIGAVTVPGVRQSDENPSNIITKKKGLSLSVFRIFYALVMRFF